MVSAMAPLQLAFQLTWCEGSRPAIAEPDLLSGAGARFPAGVGALPLMARTIERGRWCSAIPLRVGFRTKPTRDVP
jgi:hypothetical protein